MAYTNQRRGNNSLVQTHGPIFIWGFGGSTLLVIAIALFSARQGWYSFVLLAIVVLLFLIYFFFASLWSARQIYNYDDLRDKLFDLGEISAEDTLVDVNLGVREIPITMSTYLTIGRIIVIDVYNPQLTPGRSLARANKLARRKLSQTKDDPRLNWRDGSLNLLPLPDNSIKIVTLIEVASEFVQEGDRIRLLKEIFRILAPNGRLLMAERIRTPTSILTMGPGSLKLETLDYWRDFLKQCGFLPKRGTVLKDLIGCLRADKPLPEQPEQLILDL